MVERQNPSVKNPVFRRILFGILTIAVLLALLTIGVWAEVSGGTVSDGVYALKNKATGKFLDIQYDSPNAGMHIQQYAYDITPSTPDTRSGLFKFTHRGGNNYLIRSMRNNANSFYRQSDTAVLTTPIETVDIDNPMKAHWILSDAGDGYVYLRAYGTSKYLCTPSSGVNNDKYCTTETLASGGDRAKWKMVRYTGSAMYGVVLSSWTDTMTVDETTRISAYMYTTDMAYHGPVRYSVAAWDSSSADNLATVDADGNVTVNGAGRFRIRMTYAGAPTSWYWAVTARLADGVYFLQNRQMERYMQVDDDDAPNYTNNGGIMEIHPLDGEDYQRWSFTYIGDGYYKITSVVNGYALTVPAGSTTGDNVDLILKPYAGTDNQKWRITMTRNGSSKIKANRLNPILVKTLSCLWKLLCILMEPIFDKGNILIIQVIRTNGIAFVCCQQMVPSWNTIQRHGQVSHQPTTIAMDMHSTINFTNRQETAYGANNNPGSITMHIVPTVFQRAISHRQAIL